MSARALPGDLWRVSMFLADSSWQQSWNLPYLQAWCIGAAMLFPSLGAAKTMPQVWNELHCIYGSRATGCQSQSPVCAGQVCGWPGILIHSGGFLGASTGARSQRDQVSQITTKALGAWRPVPVLSKANVDSTHLHSWIYHFIHYRFM